jgi:hypothetical protein
MDGHRPIRMCLGSPLWRRPIRWVRSNVDGIHRGTTFSDVLDRRALGCCIYYAANPRLASRDHCLSLVGISHEPSTSGRHHYIGQPRAPGTLDGHECLRVVCRIGLGRTALSRTTKAWVRYSARCIRGRSVVPWTAVISAVPKRGSFGRRSVNNCRNQAFLIRLQTRPDRDLGRRPNR